MNWTGGASRRSKNAKSSVSMIQKRNFSKARGKLLGGLKSPYKHDFSMFEPGANFTFNEKDRTRKEHDENKEPEESVDIHNKDTLTVDNLTPVKFHHQTREKINVSSKGSPHSSHKHSEDQAIPSSSIKNQNSNATSPSSCKICTDRHERSKKRPKLSEADQIEAMRQQLLATDDWCGLKRARPAKMQFVDAAERDMIGKRRVIKKGNRHRQESQTRKHSRIEIDEHGNTESPSNRSSEISITGGVDHNPSPSAQRQHSSNLNSDDMLFDDELINAGQEENIIIAKADPKESTPLQSISFPVDGVPGLRLVFDYPPGDAPSHANAIENNPFPKEMDSIVLTNDAPQATHQKTENLESEQPKVALSQAAITTVVEQPQIVQKSSPPPLEDEEQIWRKFVFADDDDDGEDQESLSAASLLVQASTPTPNPSHSPSTNPPPPLLTTSPPPRTTSSSPIPPPQPPPSAPQPQLHNPLPTTTTNTKNKTKNLKFRKPSRYEGSGNRLPESPGFKLLRAHIEGDVEEEVQEEEEEEDIEDF